MLEIDKMLTLSTGHLTQATVDQLAEYCACSTYDPNERLALDQNFDGLTVYAKEGYGWFIFINDARDDPELYVSLPEDLRAVIDFALGHDCAWLCFDADGEATEELPLYE